MQDLASEFSKIFRGRYPRTLTATPSRTQHPARLLAGAQVLGPKPWSPQLFSRGCTPAA